MNRFKFFEAILAVICDRVGQVFKKNLIEYYSILDNVVGNFEEKEFISPTKIVIS